MKRILIFSLAYYPRFASGAEVAIKEITDRIDPSDIEFHLVTLLFNRADPREERIGNVLVHRVGWGGGYFSKMCYVPLAALKASILHRLYHYDALWSVMTYMLFPVVFAKMLGVNIPHLLTLQDGDTYEKVFERWFIRPFTPLLDLGMRSAGAVQTISVYLATWPPRRGYKGSVEIIPNGFSLASAAEYQETELEALKREVEKKEGEIFLISVSRLVHQKGLDTIIHALPLLPVNVKYLVVGDGPDKDTLASLAQELGVTDRVIFTGLVDRVMTAKYRKISDIFVSPSRSEGQGISFVSTMISGLPMIATQEGGLADFIFDAKRNPEKPTTGWAVDRDSPEQISVAVKDIIEHPEQARAVALTARAYARDHFDWDNIARDMRGKFFGRALK